MFVFLASIALAADPTWTGSYQLDHSAVEMEQVHADAVKSAISALPWAFREFARRPIRRVIYNCGSLGIDLTDAELTLGCDDKADKVLQRSADGRTTLDGYGERLNVHVTTTPSEMSVEMGRSEGTMTTQYVLDGDHLRVLKSLRSHWLAAPVTWEASYHRTDSP